MRNISSKFSGNSEADDSENHVEMFPQYYVCSDMLWTDSNIQSHTDILRAVKELNNYFHQKYIYFEVEV